MIKVQWAKWNKSIVSKFKRMYCTLDCSEIQVSYENCYSKWREPFKWETLYLFLIAINQLKLQLFYKY